jgi:hypothetical protein
VARGGKRLNAGRKPGAVTTKTREIAEKALAGGITPLEVMLHAMLQHYEAKRWDDAADKARDAAPYIHARLSAVEMNANVAMTHEQWLDALPDGEAPPTEG